MNEVTDRQLMAHAQQGDTAAFGELVQRTQTAVFNVALRLLGRRQDAEDAAQEAFIRAYRAREQFDPERPFAPWIKRITVNVCLNRLEAERVRPRMAVTDVARPGETAVDMDHWAQTAPTPEQTMVQQQRDARLRAAILQLRPHYRAVIELRHFQELTYEEMAVELERPLSSVKSDLFRARRRLAEILREEEGVGE